MRKALSRCRKHVLIDRCKAAADNLGLTYREHISFVNILKEKGLLQTRAPTHTPTHTYTHIHPHLHTPTHAYTHTYIRLHTPTHAYTHLHTPTHTYSRLHPPTDSFPYTRLHRPTDTPLNTLLHTLLPTYHHQLHPLSRNLKSYSISQPKSIPLYYIADT